MKYFVLLLLAVSLSYSQTIVSIKKSANASEETNAYESLLVGYLRDEIKKDLNITFSERDIYEINSIRIQLLTLGDKGYFTTSCIFILPEKRGFDKYIHSTMIATDKPDNGAKMIFVSLVNLIADINTPPSFEEEKPSKKK